WCLRSLDVSQFAAATRRGFTRRRSSMSSRSFFGKLIAFLAIPLLILTACSSTGGRETAGGDGEAAEGQVADTEQSTVAMVTHAVPGDTDWDLVRRGAEANAASNTVDLVYASAPAGSVKALLMDQP